MKNIKNEDHPNYIIFEGISQNGLHIWIQRIFVAWGSMDETTKMQTWTNSPGHRPIGVLDPFLGLFLVSCFPLALFLLACAREKGDSLGPWFPKIDTRRSSLLPCIGLMLPLGPIFPIFWATGDVSKNLWFFESSKIEKNCRINHSSGAEGRFLGQKTRLLVSLLASIFWLFSKMAKV